MGGVEAFSLRQQGQRLLQAAGDGFRPSGFGNGLAGLPLTEWGQERKGDGSLQVLRGRLLEGLRYEDRPGYLFGFDPRSVQLGRFTSPLQKGLGG